HQSGRLSAARQGATLDWRAAADAGDVHHGDTEARRLHGERIDVDVPAPSAITRRPGAARLALLLVGVALGCLALGYALIAFHPGSWAYLDYVDGYYLYVAHRMAQGAVLYSGVMGVQPPGIYLVGALLFRLHDGIASARLYSLLLHLATV